MEAQMVDQVNCSSSNSPFPLPFSSISVSSFASASSHSLNPSSSYHSLLPLPSLCSPPSLSSPAWSCSIQELLRSIEKDRTAVLVQCVRRMVHQEKRVYQVCGFVFELVWDSESKVLTGFSQVWAMGICVCSCRCQPLWMGGKREWISSCESNMCISQ